MIGFSSEPPAMFGCFRTCSSRAGSERFLSLPGDAWTSPGLRGEVDCEVCHGQMLGKDHEQLGLSENSVSHIPMDYHHVPHLPNG